MFRFEPELFSCRAMAMETLGRAGYEWLVAFTSIDLLHDTFGLEVCGIPNEEAAKEIESILQQVFREWRHSRLVYKTGDRDPGWQVSIHRDEEAEPGERFDA